MSKTMTKEELAGLGVTTDSRDVAKIWGISWRQVQRLAKSGQIPAFKVGRQWRFCTAKILAMAGIDGE